MLKGLPILLIEDDRVDAMTVERAFRKVGIGNALQILSDGEAALAHLQRHHPQPGLILLDLNMPRMTGVEFLRNLRADSRLAGIPVVVLTSSREERDVAACYRLGVSGYIVKPLDFGEFVDAIRILELYWTRNVVPNEPSG